MSSSSPPNPPLGGPDSGRPSVGVPSRGRKITVAVVVAVVVAAGVLLAVHYFATASALHHSGGPIPVVAAENFWGSLVSQMGGSRVSVLSIVTDPNADPHDYESNASDAVAVANARLVIENGAGYDNWCSQLVAASGSTNQIVLNVADVLGKTVGDNPHFWYGSAYVNATLAAMYSDLVTISPSDRAAFAANYAALNASLGVDVWTRENEIRGMFHGVQVASTESIFQYMANSTGLDLVSPVDFMTAVSEGNDPPAQSVITFENQLKSGNVSVLVYNAQTVTPITQQMKTLAAQYNVSVTAVTETLQPADIAFQVWMEGELLDLQNALNQKALGV